MPIGIYIRKKKNYDKKICVICGNKFSKREKEKPYRFKKRRCCSRQCNARLSARYCIGKKAHNNKQVERICVQCGKKKMVAPSLSKRPFCDRKCMALWYSEKQRGKAHWNWQGGITEKPSRDILYEGYKEWRRNIYRRDGFKCVLCGCDKSGELQAHHIKPRAEYKNLILDISNGLTVCKKCHKEIHYGKKI